MHKNHIIKNKMLLTNTYDFNFLFNILSLGLTSNFTKCIIFHEIQVPQDIGH